MFESSKASSIKRHKLGGFGKTTQKNWLRSMTLLAVSIQ